MINEGGIVKINVQMSDVNESQLENGNDTMFWIPFPIITLVSFSE